MNKKIFTVLLVAMCFVFSTGVIKAEDSNNLSVEGLLSGWKLSGDMSLLSTFKEPERSGDSKLNFSYFQLYAEKQLKSNLTMFLSLVVNNGNYNNDANNYETTILVDTALLVYKINDNFAANIGREIINYGYQNPISIMNEKFVFLPAISSQYFGGYILRGDGAKVTLRNSLVDGDLAYYNIPTNNSLQSKSLFARVSKTVNDLTIGVNALSTNGPAKYTASVDNIVVYGPDIKYTNKIIDFKSELMLVNRKTDFGVGEESIDKLGFYTQITGNILSNNKLYVGGRFDYVEPFTTTDKVINKYVSGVVGSYLYDNLLVRGQYKTNVDDGTDSEMGMLVSVSF